MSFVLEQHTVRQRSYYVHMDVMQGVVELCDESITEWESSNTQQVRIMPSQQFTLISYLPRLR